MEAKYPPNVTPAYLIVYIPKWNTKDEVPTIVRESSATNVGGTNPNSIAKNARALLVKSVFDKLKADVNVNKINRCVSLKWSDTLKNVDPESWTDFETKVKEGILHTLEQTLILFQHEIVRLDALGQLLPYYQQKQEMTDLFDAVQLYDDALYHLDDAEEALTEGSSLYFKVLERSCVLIIDDRARPDNH